jgi:hypothetical protein
MFEFLAKAKLQTEISNLARVFVARAGIDLSSISGWKNASIASSVRNDIESRKSSLARHVKPTELEIQILYSIALYESKLLSREQSERIYGLIANSASASHVFSSSLTSKKVSDWLSKSRS